MDRIITSSKINVKLMMKRKVATTQVGYLYRKFQISLERLMQSGNTIQGMNLYIFINYQRGNTSQKTIYDRPFDFFVGRIPFFQFGDTNF